MTKNDAVSTSVMQLHSDFWHTLYYSDDEIRDDAMEARCNAHGKLENRAQYFSHTNRGNKSPIRSKK